MSSNSINTNVGAIVALQNLNVTSTSLQETQNQISTGLAVSGAKDNGAIWNIAQNSRASISSLDAVKQSLQRAQSTVDVAVSAGQTISDILNQIKAKSVAGSDNSLDTVSRKALNNDVQALIAQIQKIVSTADFNGANIIKTNASTIYALANASGGSKLTILPSNAITTHLNFISNLQDSLTQGVGNLVDADVAKESAHLTALQTKQQLGVQALSIANSSKQGLLSLFR